MLGRSRVIFANLNGKTNALRNLIVKNQQSIVATNLRSNKMGYQAVRYMATKNDGSNSEAEKTETEASQEKNTGNSVVKMDYDEYDDYEPQTKGEKVAYYSTLIMRLMLLCGAGVCIFFTARELFPGRMSPNSLFSEVFELLQYKDEVSNFLECIC